MRIEESSILLKGLRFSAKHGVLPQERVVGGEYVVNVCIDCDLSKAVKSDDVEDTLNYAEVYDWRKHSESFSASEDGRDRNHEVQSSDGG